MIDGTGLAEVLLGLPGFRVVDEVETDCEVVIWIESVAARAFCQMCGVCAEPPDRMRVDVRLWPASVGRHGWCGTSGGGVAGSRGVRHRCGPRRASTSTRRRC
jgi:hypothetical protein